MESTKEKHIISYDCGYAIRAIAMLMIIFVHSINEYECYSSNISHLLLIPMFGILGCCLFFFMSGYGMVNSLYKNRPTARYLITHIKKIIIPVIVVYIINSILLPHTMAYNNIEIDHYNIFTLSLPEGTDIWFIKIILFDYITTFLLFKLIAETKKRLIYLAIVQTALVATLFLCKAGGYWYISNLCFVLGAIHTTYPVFKKKHIAMSITLFAIYYLCIINGIVSAPIQIVGGLAFCVIALCALEKTSYRPQWLLYIGKNSLLYYLLSIPAMWLIQSNTMHFTLYFAANIIATTIFVFAYKGIAKLLTEKIHPTNE